MMRHAEQAAFVSDIGDSRLAGGLEIEPVLSVDAAYGRKIDRLNVFHSRSYTKPRLQA